MERKESPLAEADQDQFHVRIHPYQKNARATAIRIFVCLDAGLPVYSVMAASDGTPMAEILVRKDAQVTPARDDEIQAAVETMLLFYGPGLSVLDYTAHPITKEEKAN